MNTKEKGDLLEIIIEKMCSGVEKAEVTRNVKIMGKKTQTKRQVDVLITGQVGVFDVKIVVEAKNYKEPIGVDKVESLKSKLSDIGADLGVVVCPSGFTEPAKKSAEFDGIQLFQIYDHNLGNSNLFIPLRYVEPEIKSYSFVVKHRASGSFTISQDISHWRFHIDNKVVNAKQLVACAWNKKMISQKPGRHIADFGVMAICDKFQLDIIQYCEIAINIVVAEKYYLKLFSASFLKKLGNGEKYFNLNIDTYSKEGDMLKNGWKMFGTFEDMDLAADIDNQPEGIRNLIIRPDYILDISLESD